MATVQIPGSELIDKQMAVHTSKKNADVSLAQEIQKQLSVESHRHGILYNGKHKKSK